jgi:hypothetical protein
MKKKKFEPPRRQDTKLALVSIFPLTGESRYPLFSGSRLPPGKRDGDTGMNLVPWCLGGPVFHLFPEAA